VYIDKIFKALPKNGGRRRISSPCKAKTPFRFLRCGSRKFLDIPSLENWWPEEIFNKLATSFGGELIVDGDIFYSDGIQKERIIYAFRIQLNPTSTAHNRQRNMLS
jgi:hypothetical protein